MKIVLTYTELRALLAPVIPHACTDDMLPVLCRIAVATSGDQLVAQATNRFTAAFQRVKPAKRPPKTFGVQIHVRDAKRLLHLLRPIKDSNPSITLDVDKDGSLAVSADDDGLALGFSGVNLRFPSVLGDGGGQFPNLSTLMPTEFDDKKVAAAVGLNPDLLHAFKAAADQVRRTDGDHAATVYLHMPEPGNKNRTACAVTIGRDFIGLIMPRASLGGRALSQRAAASSEVRAVLDTWRDQIPVFKPLAKAAS